MQFILTAWDGNDEEAPVRRMNAREKHLSNVRKLKEEGHFIWGGALLDDNKNMKGSVVVYEYESRKELDMMLKDEPYMKAKVWHYVDIHNFKLADI